MIKILSVRTVKEPDALNEVDVTTDGNDYVSLWINIDGHLACQISQGKGHAQITSYVAEKPVEFTCSEKVTPTVVKF